MGDRFAAGDQVRVDTRSGESFYGTYLRWRANILYEHLVKLVLFRDGSEQRLRIGEEVPCVDPEVQACRFVVDPPMDIDAIDRFLSE